VDGVAGCPQIVGKRQEPGRPPLRVMEQLPSARIFIERHYAAANTRILHHHRDAFFAWTGAAYAEVQTTALRAEIYKMLEHAMRRSGNDYVMTPR
jgi:hypothetical protein